MIAKVVERATARAVCLALAEALARFGVPEEIITDNGKQFTDRFGRCRPRTGEVLFDKICRKNGITHRPAAPASPNQNGKVERFHGTLRPEFLDTAGPFASLAEAQAAIDAYVQHYNTDRPHQGLDVTVPVTPADRFQPVPVEQRALVDLWLPTALDTTAVAPIVHDAEPVEAEPVRIGQPAVEAEQPGPWAGGPVEFDRVVPPCGNMIVCQRQFWMGTHRAGMVARIWADCDLINVLIAGARIKRATVMFYDLQSRELLRTRANPLTPEQVMRLRGLRPAGPPPRPPVEPIRVQRRASNTGVIMVAGQKVALGRHHRHRTLTVTVSDNTLAVDLGDCDVKVVRRTTTQPVRSIKGQRPRTASPC